MKSGERKMRGGFSAESFLAAVLCLITIFAGFARAEEHQIQNLRDSASAIEKTKKLLTEIVEKSFPELSKSKLKVKSFHSRTTFFKARFSFTRFFTFQRMRTTVFVNPLVFMNDAPEEGIRAILAHELAHALYYKEKNRLELLGLVALTEKGFAAKFERRTDLVAIGRGYGAGLIAYREWLYKNVPEDNLAAKKRDYFTPEEIAVLMTAIEKKPEVIKILLKNVPRNLKEVEKIVSF